MEELKADKRRLEENDGCVCIVIRMNNDLIF